MAHTAQHRQTNATTQSRLATGPSVLRRAAAALIVVLLGLLALVSAPAAAQAAPLHRVVTAITISSATDPVRVGDPVTVNVTWTVPIGAVAGDTFSVSALSNAPLTNVPGTVVATSGSGEKLASCAVELKNVTCTMLVSGLAYEGMSSTVSYQAAFTTAMDDSRVTFAHAKMLYYVDLPGGVAGPFTQDEPRTLTLTKAVDGPAPSGNFTFTLGCTLDGTTVDGFPQTKSFAAGQTARFTSLTVGSVCEILETINLGAESVTYSSPITFSNPGTFTVTEASPAVIKVTATNHFAVPPVEPAAVGGLTVTKAVVGDGDGDVPDATSFSVLYSYSLDGTVVTGSLPILAGETATLDDLPVGTVVTLSEPAIPDVTDVTWGVPAFTVTGSTDTTAPTVDVTIATDVVAVLLTNTAIATPAVPVPATVTPAAPVPTVPLVPAAPVPTTPLAPAAPVTSVTTTPVSGVMSAYGTRLPITHTTSARIQSLATTGASTLTVLVLAAGLTAGGATLVAARRRRSGQH